MINITAPFAFWTRTKSRTRSPSQSWGHFAGLPLSLLVLFLTAALTSPAHAEVSLRIAEPIIDPVTIRAEVTDESGPVTNLDAGDFTVTVNGNEITSGITFAQPPREDPSQSLSVIFVMDYSGSVVPAFETAMITATQNFLDTMEVGDYAGIIKFDASANLDTSVVAPLQVISSDDVRNALKEKAGEPRVPGFGTAVFDAIKKALDEFGAALATDSFPSGPKAIIIVSDGLENDSISNRQLLRDLASQLGVTISSIGVGEVSETTTKISPSSGEDILQSLADITGGTYDFTSDGTGIQEIYEAFGDLLLNEYVLSFDYGIAACQDYTIQVAVDAYGEATEAVKSSQASCGGSSSGGGGAIGPLGLIAGLSLLAFRRRRMPA